MTTGRLANILERRYHIMETFWDRNSPEIVKTMEQSYLGAVNAISAGADPSRLNPAAAGASKIERMFKESLAMRMYDGLPGVPTQASLQGVSHRMAKPYAKFKWRGGKRTKQRRPSRPSFIDTGLFQNSFTVWVETTP
jgi:hypothetical protein